MVISRPAGGYEMGVDLPHDLAKSKAAGNYIPAPCHLVTPSKAMQINLEKKFNKIEEKRL